MKTRSLLSTLLCAIIALPALAGMERGNGGDGIVAGGKTVMYDLYERGLDADQALGDFASALGKSRNYPVTAAADRAVSDLSSGEGESDLGQALGYLLSQFGDSNPVLVQAILGELQTFHWSVAGADLLPNPDTQSRLSLSGVKQIGCARNRNGVLLLSPSCDAMSASNRAALLVHEAIYSLYRKYHPGAADSFEVRTLTAAFFDSKLDKETGLRKLERQSGLDAIAASEDQVQALFFASNYWHVTARHCSFKSSHFKSIALRFGGGLSFNGEIVTSDADDSDALIAGASQSGDSAANTWQPELPAFDVANKTMTLQLGRDFGDGESATATFAFDGSKQVTFTDGAEVVQGTCR